MSRRANIIKNMIGYEEILRDAETCQKYGHDYRNDRGVKADIINLLHPKIIDLVVAGIKNETPDAKTLRLVPANGYLPPFLAGQYINVYGETKGVRTSRPYSISSSPRQRAYYEITVARIHDGFFSNHLLDSISKGDAIQSSSPSGQFYFNPLFHNQHSVFIAGGSGITPFISMIREFCDAGLRRKVTLLYGNRNDGQVIFHDELLSLSEKFKNFRYIPVFSESSKTQKGRQGFIDAACIRDEVENVNQCTFYICGPKAMYDFCVPQLESLNIARKHIRKEMFASAANITKEPGWPSDLSGREEFSVKVQGRKNIKARSGETLLSSLEREGIIIPVNCRCGECSVCRVRLVSGKVFQPRGVHLRHSDAKSGYVHSCKCYPIGDLEIMI